MTFFFYFFAAKPSESLSFSHPLPPNLPNSHLFLSKLKQIQFTPSQNTIQEEKNASANKNASVLLRRATFIRSAAFRQFVALKC